MNQLPEFSNKTDIFKYINTNYLKKLQVSQTTFYDEKYIIINSIYLFFKFKSPKINVSGENKDKFYFFLAIYYYTIGKYSDSYLYLLKIKNKDSIRLIYVLLGLVCRRLGKFVEMKYFLLLGINNKNGRCANNLGLYYDEIKKKYYKAIKYYEIAAELHYQWAKSNLGLLYRTIFKNNDLAKYYLLQIKPINHLHACYSLALIFYEEKQIKLMTKYFNIYFKYYNIQNKVKFLYDKYKQDKIILEYLWLKLPHIINLTPDLKQMIYKSYIIINKNYKIYNNYTFVSML